MTQAIHHEPEQGQQHRYGELVQPGRIHGSLYTDPALFAAEIKRIFHRTWVWVAHESELPQPGDFKLTQVGLQPVIVSRDKDGNIHVLLNRCRHRAATVCEQQRGNTTKFICPYHGWTYASDGRLTAVSSPEGYTGILDKKQLGLVRARVETYRGLVFASLHADVEPLVDFLGAARPWIDHFMNQGALWPLRAAGEHKLTFRGNWKIQLENTTDFYHFPIVHRSFIDDLDRDTARSLTSFMTRDDVYCRSLGNGHSVAVHNPATIDPTQDDGAPIPAIHQPLAEQLAKELAPEAVRRVIRSLGGVGFNLNLFPNLGLSTAFLRELRPLAVDRTEVRHIALTMDGGPAAANRVRLRFHEHFQGPAGFGSPDDAEAWERIQRGAQAGPDLWVLVNRGLNRETRTDDGYLSSHVTDETGMREGYAMWQRMMSV